MWNRRGRCFPPNNRSGCGDSLKLNRLFPLAWRNAAMCLRDWEISTTGRDKRTATWSRHSWIAHLIVVMRMKDWWQILDSFRLMASITATNLCWFASWSGSPFGDNLIYRQIPASFGGFHSTWLCSTMGLHWNFSTLRAFISISNSIAWMNIGVFVFRWDHEKRLQP